MIRVPVNIQCSERDPEIAINRLNYKIAFAEAFPKENRTVKISRVILKASWMIYDVVYGSLHVTLEIATHP